jgi:methionyl-tRNA synthetase
MDEHQLHTGMAAAFDLIDATNEFITRSEPWVLARTPERRADLDQALFEMAEAVRIAAILLWPAMPTSCAEILRRMGQVEPVSDIRLDRDAAWAGGERQIVKGPPLWPRIEENAPAPAAVAVAPGGAAISKGAGDTMANETEPAAGQPPAEDGAASAAGTAGTTTEGAEAARLSFDDFMKLQLRVATVVAAEAIPKSKKLLKVTVDVGAEQRTIVAGVARVYAPETLVGRTVVIVANLEKATLMGVESNGMVLAATDPDGRPVLVTVDDPAAAPPGSRVR